MWLLVRKRGARPTKMMESAKRPFQKRGSHQLDRPPQNGSPSALHCPLGLAFAQTWDPSSWLLPGTWISSRLADDALRTLAPSFHEDTPTKGEYNDTQALWKLRGSFPKILSPRSLVTGSSVLPCLLFPLLAFLAR